MEITYPMMDNLLFFGFFMALGMYGITHAVMYHQRKTLGMKTNRFWLFAFSIVSPIFFAFAGAELVHLIYAVNQLSCS